MLWLRLEPAAPLALLSRPLLPCLHTLLGSVHAVCVEQAGKQV